MKVLLLTVHLLHLGNFSYIPELLLISVTMLFVILEVIKQVRMAYNHSAADAISVYLSVVDYHALHSKL